MGTPAYARGVSKPVQAPYPPDVEEGQPPTLAFDDLVDTVATGLDWANEQARGFSALRAELRRCRLTGAELAEGSLTDVTFDECRVDLVARRLSRLPDG